MNIVSELVKFFAFPLDSLEIQSLLATLPPHRVDKPSDGSQYVISREGGFDLLFEDKNAVVGHHQNRTLACIFLYASGADKHKEFIGDLPFDFTFCDARDNLLAKRRPNRTWLIGKGRVSVNHSSPSSDTWQAIDFNISASYNGDGGIHCFQISPPALLNEEDWQAPPTWQELVIMPSQMLAAIKLYQKEHGVNVGEAKKAVDAYLAQQGT